MIAEKGNTNVHERHGWIKEADTKKMNAEKRPMYADRT